MEVKVFDGERFERGRRWYIIFLSVFIFMILISILTKNLIGAILLFFFLGGYIVYSLTSSKVINVVISDEGLKIGGKLYSWNTLDGFVLEIDEQKQTFKNIVFLRGNDKLIHTFSDDNDKIKEFVQNLYEYLPMSGDYQQSMIDKLARMLKL